jgi:hypothetical protein
MGLRVVVVVAFFAMTAVPGYLAWVSGVLPGPTEASADSAIPGSGADSAVATIVWPDEPLGLAAAGTRIYWEQRDPAKAAAGIWYYDVSAGRKARLLGRAAAGTPSGSMAAAGDLVVWTTWPHKRGVGKPAVQAYNSLSTRRWEAAAAGRAPAAAGALTIWAEPDPRHRGSDIIRGVSTLTDEEFRIDAGGRVVALATSGRRAAWLAGRGDTHPVWAGSFTKATSRKLADDGTAVAIDRERVVWAAAVGDHTTSIVAWDRRQGRSTVLTRLPGTTPSLSLSRSHAVWVTTNASDGSRVWAYDFGAREAYPVSTAGSRKVGPVIVAGDVYWADDRAGRWELRTRPLQH